jgi:intracellular septation protein A
MVGLKINFFMAGIRNFYVARFLHRDIWHRFCKGGGTAICVVQMFSY